MKKFQKAIGLVLGVFLLTVFAVFSVSCNQEKSVTATVEKVNESTVAIFVLECSGGATVLDAMKSLQKKGELSFEISSGMVTEMEGKANGGSSYWMLYTDDNDFATDEYGTVEYGGQTLGSAVLGANALQVSVGKTYVWIYTTF